MCSQGGHFQLLLPAQSSEILAILAPRPRRGLSPWTLPSSAGYGDHRRDGGQATREAPSAERRLVSLLLTALPLLASPPGNKFTKDPTNGAGQLRQRTPTEVARCRPGSGWDRPVRPFAIPTPSPAGGAGTGQLPPPGRPRTGPSHTDTVCGPGRLYRDPEGAQRLADFLPLRVDSHHRSKKPSLPPRLDRLPCVATGPCTPLMAWSPFTNVPTEALGSWAPGMGHLSRSPPVRSGSALTVPVNEPNHPTQGPPVLPSPSPGPQPPPGCWSLQLSSPAPASPDHTPAPMLSCGAPRTGQTQAPAASWWARWAPEVTPGGAGPGQGSRDCCPLRRDPGVLLGWEPVRSGGVFWTGSREGP